MKESQNLEENNGFWSEGYFAETMDPREWKKRKRTFSMGHDEEMNYNCKRCNKKISAHNKDWHDGMCDSCFDKEYHQEFDETQKTLLDM